MTHGNHGKTFAENRGKLHRRFAGSGDDDIVEKLAGGVYGRIMETSDDHGVIVFLSQIIYLYNKPVENEFLKNNVFQIVSACDKVIIHTDAAGCMTVQLGGKIFKGVAAVIEDVKISDFHGGPPFIFSHYISAAEIKY